MLLAPAVRIYDCLFLLQALTGTNSPSKYLSVVESDRGFHVPERYIPWALSFVQIYFFWLEPPKSAILCVLSHLLPLFTKATRAQDLLDGHSSRYWFLRVENRKTGSIKKHWRYSSISISSATYTECCDSELRAWWLPAKLNYFCSFKFCRLI